MGTVKAHDIEDKGPWDCQDLEDIWTGSYQSLAFGNWSLVTGARRQREEITLMPLHPTQLVESQLDES